MKISSGTMVMQSERKYTSSAKVTKKFRLQTDSERNTEGVQADIGQVKTDPETVFEQFRQLTIRSIFAMLFGEKKARELFTDRQLSSEQTMLSTGSLVRYQANMQYTESESTSFSAEGLVHTADGRDIKIRVDVGMSRSFEAAFSKDFVMKTTDPLVLNFNGNAAELSDQKFFFDLDCDGQKEQLSVLAEGSGYLALDKNGDGVIGDGSELFGPGNGDGFVQLSAYDEDHNGWIDENDAVFSALKIWCRDADGREKLYSLKEKGVGAICLGHAATPFSLNNASNVTKGVIRSTGIFLYENGNAGTVQQLDLAT